MDPKEQASVPQVAVEAVAQPLVENGEYLSLKRKSDEVREDKRKKKAEVAVAKKYYEAEQAMERYLQCEDEAITAKINLYEEFPPETPETLIEKDEARNFTMEQHGQALLGLFVYGYNQYAEIARKFVPAKTRSQVQQHIYTFRDRRERRDNAKDPISKRSVNDFNYEWSLVTMCARQTLVQEIGSDSRFRQLSMPRETTSEDGEKLPLYVSVVQMQGRSLTQLRNHLLDHYTQ